MGRTPFEAVRTDCIAFLVGQARLMTRESELVVVVGVDLYPDDRGSTGHRFVMAVPGQWRGLLIGNRGSTATLVRGLLRIFILSLDCDVSVDVRVL